MNPVILLTGATGFVGQQVLRSLSEKNVSIRLVLRDGSEISEIYKNKIEKIIRTSDMFSESSSWWANACENIDIAVHVAWYAEPGRYLQSSKNFQCLTGTLNLAKGAGKAGVRRFVGVGTCFEYDLKHNVLSVDTPIKPLTPYAGAKAATYFALSQLLPIHKIEFAWCRLFYLYGENEDSRRLVPYVHSRLSAGKEVELTSGNQIRDFMDVYDAGNCIADIATNNIQGSVNICSGTPITVRQLVEKIADKYGRRDLLKFGVRKDNLVDPPCIVGIK